MSVKILATDRTTRLNPKGDPVEMYRVWIRTARGSTGTVEIDPSDWTPEHIREIIEAEGEKLDLPYTVFS